MLRSLMFVGLLFLPCVASADEKAADACAAGLDADAKVIYTAAKPSYHPGADLRALMMKVVKPLVENGTVHQPARDHAMAAAVCLKKMD